MIVRICMGVCMRAESKQLKVMKVVRGFWTRIGEKIVNGNNRERKRTEIRMSLVQIR